MPRKNYSDSIVGRVVQDYLELSIGTEGMYFDAESGKIEPNSKYGLVTFVDLQPGVQVSSRNNIVLTTVQGRDYTRKEFVSGVTWKSVSPARLPVSTPTSTRKPKSANS
ncbi:hypothetical protein SFC43_13265 [Bacteroides sp. CR5/BHMF/2]|nr:hypothetical protein [Bacteroides sp. CR5/BHMF/2]